mmetsp:Transcript_54807/g.177305  ORF Transcript_54807/g.177305 Transcript_54807/m.177305 type:complete len:135 (-) Transcript_54807:12-416(-)
MHTLSFRHSLGATSAFFGQTSRELACIGVVPLGSSQAGSSAITLPRSTPFAAPEALRPSIDVFVMKLSQRCLAEDDKKNKQECGASEGQSEEAHVKAGNPEKDRLAITSEGAQKVNITIARQISQTRRSARNGV